MRVQSLVPLIVTLIVASAGADVEIISSNREVIADIAGGGDSDMTGELGPWEAIVEDSDDAPPCEPPGPRSTSVASASQDSSITPATMNGFGSVSGSCHCPGWYDATSTIVVSFNLLSARQCSLQGTLTRFCFDDFAQAEAEVSLVGPDGTIFEFIVDGSGSETVQIDTTAPLSAGGPYTLQMRADVGGAGAVWWYGVWGDASFDLTFGLCPIANEICAADLNDDGQVDGADVGILLGSWGAGAAGDLDCDGTTDGEDLANMLADWGQCVLPP